MPMFVSADEITRHLKINTRKPITDEQLNAYEKLNDQAIITEADVLDRQHGTGLWSTTLVKKYLRPFSLGPGHPVSALGQTDRYTRAKNLYRRGDVAKAWATIPADIRENRESIVGGY